MIVGRKLYKIVLLEDNMIDNRKLKVYLDTSVVSYLMQVDAPEKTGITLNLWEKFKTGVYDIFISQMLIVEVNNCDEPKRTFLLEKLNEIKYKNLQLKNSTYDLANEIIKLGILTQKSIEDCQHIAVAIENDCDVIISWNFKHMVNIRTVKGIRAITNLKGYKTIEIMTPETLLEMEE